MAVIIIVLLVVLLFSLPSVFASRGAGDSHSDSKTSAFGCLGLFLLVFIIGSNLDSGRDEILNKANKENALASATKQPLKKVSATATPLPEEESYLNVHFLDVGQGDAALIVCDNKAMLIDGGSSSESDFIFAYLSKYNIIHLDYVVATHGHEDHVGGLSGALNYTLVDTVLCSTKEYDSEEFKDFIRYANRKNAEIIVPKVGDVFNLGSATFEIIGPISDSDNHNDTSLVIRLEYGDTSFLFTGDAEVTEEYEIIASGKNVRSDVLKVGHHGSVSSTSPLFLRRVSPEWAVISVGKNNAYNFPDQETIEALRKANIKVARTDMQGTIICVSDGKNLEFYVERNANVNTLTTPSPVPTKTPSPTLIREQSERNYVLNKNTKKFHYPSCGSVGQMKESNKLFFTGTRDEVISMGYKSCGKCHP